MTEPKCALCAARLCDHQDCRFPGLSLDAVTAVAGTPCCEDCAPALMQLVLHPVAAILPQVAPG